MTIRPGMRFCMVTTFYPPYAFGGDAMYVQQLSNELAKRGHHVEVIHSRDAYDLLAGQGPAAAEVDHPNVTVHALRSRWRFLSSLLAHQTGQPTYYSSRIKEIFRRRFDVIHYHNVSLVGGPGVLHYGDAIKLYTLHEYWLACPTHMLFKFNRKVCTRKRCLACTIVHRRPPQLWRYAGAIRGAVKEVDLFIAPTEFAKKQHIEMGLKIPIAELPYFTSRWESPGPRPPLGLSPYFLFVGRLEKIKGLQSLLPVFRRYEKAQLWIVGTGAYEMALRRMANGAPNIRFLGYQSGKQLRTLYSQAVATIVPSLWQEIFGIVILEAFSQATPVIVRNRGGMPQVIAESGAGFVFETEQELLFAMDRLLGDPSLRDELGRRGYEAFRNKWSAEVHLSKYLGIIERIAASRRKHLTSGKICTDNVT